MQTSDRTFDAPDHVDDCCLNLVDWGSSNILAIALGNTVMFLCFLRMDFLELIIVSFLLAHIITHLNAKHNWCNM